MSQNAKRSAGLLMYRRRNHDLEVFLVHPGGPYWANKDVGGWSLPKGEYSDNENALDAAKREFKEETGFDAPVQVAELGELKQPSGKIVMAWACEGDCDPQALQSNTFTLEWPPRSGNQMEFPEVDRGDWFSLAEARERLIKGQLGFIERLVEKFG